jgi:hypothetical protein
MSRGRPSHAPGILLMEHQQKDNWCWCAVTVSVLAFYTGEKRTQCSHAARVRKPADCCSDPDACDLPTSLSASLNDAGVLRDYIEKPLSYDELQVETSHGRIVCARIAWDEGGFHFVAVDTVFADATQLRIKDPLYGESIATYDGLLRYREMGQWIGSYTTKRP